MVELIAFGSNTIDEYYTVSHWPQPGDKVFISNRQMFTGGMIGNTACNFSQLGNRTVMFDYLPLEDSKDAILENLKNYGVNTDYIEFDSKFPLSKCLILIHQDERIVYVQKNNHKLTLSEKQTDFLSQDKIFYTNIEDLSRVTNLDVLKKSKITIVIDVEFNALKKTKNYLEYLKLAEIIFLNENANDYLKSLDEHWDSHVNAKYIITTRGSRGSEIKHENQIIHTPVCPADVVDSTGAGDAFHASFIHAIYHHYPVEKAMRFASAGASLSITKMGPRGHIESENAVYDYARKKGYLIEKENLKKSR